MSHQEHKLDLERLFQDMPLDLFQGASTLQEDLIIDQIRLDGLYKEAYDLYQEKKYGESRELFVQLVTLNPWKQEYWMGLAASLHLGDALDEALKAYALAALLEDSDPYPHYYAAQCLFSLKQSDEAKKALNMARERSQGTHNYLSLIQRIRVMEHQFEEQNGS